MPRRLALVCALLPLLCLAPAASAATGPGPLPDGTYIGVGSAGEGVRDVQRRLRVERDGIFGPVTERAVRRFQERRDLLVDGVVGRQTQAALTPRTAPEDAEAPEPDEDAGEEPADEEGVGARRPAPDTEILSGPSALEPTTLRTATVTFSSNQRRVRFQCRLNAAPYRSCRSPWTVRDLRAGKHRIRVRAVTATGRRDKTPAVAAWVVETAEAAAKKARPGATPTPTPVPLSTATPAATAAAASTPAPTATPAPASTLAQTVTCGWGTFKNGSWPGACWRPYADDSFFNTPLPADPKLLANSDAMVARIKAMGHVPDLPVAPRPGNDYFHPIFWSQPTDPEYTVRCTKYGGGCEISGMKVRIPPEAKPAQGSDGHMTVIDQTTGWEWDFWQVASVPLPPAGGEILISYGGRTRIDGPGGGDADSASDANAAHTGNAGGIIRLQELAAGRIDHALFLMTACSNGAYVYPARGKAAVCADTTNAPAAGQWVRLNMTAAEIDALPGVAGWQKTIFKALAKYGGFVGDTGGNESISFQLESPMTYTSFGVQDPWLPWVEAERTKPNHNTWAYTNADGSKRYTLMVSKNFDIFSRLQVVDPCVIARTC